MISRFKAYLAFTAAVLVVVACTVQPTHTSQPPQRNQCLANIGGAWLPCRDVGPESFPEHWIKTFRNI